MKKNLLALVVALMFGAQLAACPTCGCKPKGPKMMEEGKKKKHKQTKRMRKQKYSSSEEMNA